MVFLKDIRNGKGRESEKGLWEQAIQRLVCENLAHLTNCEKVSIVVHIY